MTTFQNFISTKQAAREIGCTPRRIRQMLQEGKLLGIKIFADRWLVDRSSLESVKAPPRRGRPRSGTEGSDKAPAAAGLAAFDDATLIAELERRGYLVIG